MRISKIIVVLLVLSVGVYAQEAAPATQKKFEIKELKYALNEDGSHFVKFNFLNQVWFRYNESNPGTTVFGTPKDQTYDIGLRRTRMQLFGQITDRIFFYTQFGQNNLSNISPRKQGIFFLDALGEIMIIDKNLSIGGGLTAWSGLSRYASPSVGTILTLDAPLYQQATNDVNDQFLRKLSIYAKGKLGKLDYRVALSDPMSVQNSTVQQASIGENSLFSSEPGKAQFHGYFMYQFKDQESNQMPYNTGSYLGKKEVFNVGAGFLSQANAMWHTENNGSDTVRNGMNLFAVDLFYDKPLNKEKQTALTAYACYSIYDFGKNYVRNVGAMNPANGTKGTASFNGAGIAFPMIGTGNIVYVQAGYLCRNDLFKKAGTLQPFAALQYAKFDLLADGMAMYELGVNWLIDGNRAKLSFEVQNRPVFTAENGLNRVTDRKNMFVVQLQVAI